MANKDFRDLELADYNHTLDTLCCEDCGERISLNEHEPEEDEEGNTFVGCPYCNAVNNL